MSRRIVQDVESSKPAIRQRGYVYQKGRKKGEPWNPKELSYGGYRVDIPGQPGQREVRAPLGYCRDEMGAMLKLQQVMGQAGVLDVGKVRERIASSSATTFRAQAAWLIQAMTTGEIVHAKKRTQIDPNTIDSYSTAIAYLNEQVGDKPLASIDNPEAKNVVAAMKSAAKNGKRRFSDKSIVTYFQILKKVIASALDDKFRPVHQREWHLAAIGLPRVNPKKQLRPTCTAQEMTTLLDKAEGQPLMYYFLLVTSGLRPSEAVALEIDKHFSADRSIIYVRQQREKHANVIKSYLKTEAGKRDVDMHPEDAAILRNYIGDRKSGFLFQTANGTMFDPNNINRDSLDHILKEMGRDEAGTRFYIFRRFREAVLQRSEARQLLIDYWMAHTNGSMGDRYGKQLLEDIEYRQREVSKIGRGFELPQSLLGLLGLQIANSTIAA